ncbi:anaerobic ribonucleoside-triphosphate reductase activating protein [Orenia metallireducens]|uniref:Anaerobic ribonucleoside-triphosphate reductase activating protein n=1 Tax=Orenia metallireducens TaxID=1413210 RepID=A0A1C0A5U5_9FIRM|nr:anaerobic ribonucleoside-triphosphate reductase activating protein [Orenia metallireducens]OCL25466.1 anaerobic ribonucleoside-triphosphate reductase activating protein [Orenia metallireducens]
MKIAGLQRTSLIDYPEHIATVVFTQGCNYRCPYCHNSSLIDNSFQESSYLTLEDFWSFIKKRKKLIDGVSITGGEPTLQTGLIDFIRELKAKGLKVKLDTNGSNPDILTELIEENLLDYIAMDIKSSLKKYSKVTGQCDLDKVKKSIDLIKNSNIDYEFRTTVVPTLHTEEEFEDIGKLISGAKLYFIQNFRPINTLDEKLKELSSFPPDKLNRFKEIVSPYVAKVEIRN